MYVLSLATAAMLNVGFMNGQHLVNDELNNTHPYIQYEYESVGVSAFVNSFENLSLAVYHKAQLGNDNLKLTLRTGLTTGYNRDITYENRRYILPTELFIVDGVMLMLSPEVRYNIHDNVYVNSMLMGDSLSFGFGISF